MKKTSIALVICLLISCLTSFVVSADDFDVVVIDGVPCVKDEVVLSTNVFYDPDDYTNAEGTEFLGVRIVKLKALFPCETDEELKAWQEKVGDLYPYCATTDGEISLEDAIKVLSEQKTVLAAGLNAVSYPNNEPNTDGELEAYKDEIYTKGELTLITTVYYDPNDYVGEGPFDFLGVDIVEITCRSSMPEGEIPTNGIWYEIRLADNWKAYEAILVLESNETVKSVYLNSLVYPDAPVDQQMESVSWFRYIGENVEDIKWNDEFISTVFIVEADRPLAPVVVDGKEYFFGLSFERFVDLSKNGEYRYEVKLEYDRASSIVPKATMKRVIECGEGVTNVTISTIYGSGDTNYDDVIDVYDYILVKRMCMETYDWPFTSQVGAADINLDSKVDQYDYILVKRHVLGTYEIIGVQIIP